MEGAVSHGAQEVMADWRHISNLSSAGGHPQQFHDELGDEVFVCAFVRVSGGDDSRTPRRVIGLGSTRSSAAASAERAMSRYDSMGRVVSTR